MFGFCVLVFLCLQPKHAVGCVLTAVRIMQRAIWRSGMENIGRIKHVIGIVNFCTRNLVWRALLSQSGKTDGSHVVHGRAKLSIYSLSLVSPPSRDKYGPGRSMGSCLARPRTASLQRAVCSLCPGWPWAALDHTVSSLQIHRGLVTRRKGFSARGSCLLIHGSSIRTSCCLSLSSVGTDPGSCG